MLVSTRPFSRQAMPARRDNRPKQVLFFFGGSANGTQLLQCSDKARAEPIQSISVHAPEDDESPDCPNAIVPISRGKKHQCQDQNRARGAVRRKFRKPLLKQRAQSVGSSAFVAWWLNPNQRGARGTNCGSFSPPPTLRMKIGLSIGSPGMPLIGRATIPPCLHFCAFL